METSARFYASVPVSRHEEDRTQRAMHVTRRINESLLLEGSVVQLHGTTPSGMVGIPH